MEMFFLIWGVLFSIAGISVVLYGSIFSFLVYIDKTEDKNAEIIIIIKKYIIPLGIIMFFIGFLFTFFLSYYYGN